MAIGLVGRKCGMTRIFTENGVSIPVTAIDVEPNRAAQVKAAANDGYSSVQVPFRARAASRLPKAAAGHFGEAGFAAGRGLWEFRVTDGYTAGQELTVALFDEG